ncbi:hypothetical protein H4219_002600 [Mycoemilia scoparia]|uniref:MAGE domain-containing protein n=1 Tax=Mycoemilia scoparia TaxID=417184 RepID=A0A9W8DQD3_9FUNG|nr:hypothetical protein H4219_002600 [Mycoemilia scoparia]
MSQTDSTGSSNLERLAQDLVRYALACQASKKTIKREDIRTKVLADHHKSAFNGILAHAQNILKVTFGLQLVELPANERGGATKTGAKEKQSSKTVQTWVLQSILPAQTRQALPIPLDEEKEKTMGLLVVVLSLIFVNNSNLPEDALTYYLKELGVPKLKGFENMVQGDTEAYIRQILSNFIKAGYLNKVNSTVTQASVSTQTQTQATEDMLFHYYWGPRAKVEFSPRDIAEIIAELSGEECNAEFLDRVGRARGEKIGKDPLYPEPNNEQDQSTANT